MSASLRFLAMAIVGWTGIRAVTLGVLPGSEAFTLGRNQTSPREVSAAGDPALVPTEFPTFEPAPDETLQSPAGESATSATQTAHLPGPSPAPGPIYFYPAGPPAPVPYAHASLPAPRPGRLPPIDAEPAEFYAPIPQLDEWPLSRMASAALPPHRSAVTIPQQSFPQAAVKARLDRLQLSAWALLRGEPGPSSLATGGTLGGSQAGTRLSYTIMPGIAASIRASSSVGGARGGELAAGVRITPFRSIPVSLTAERRQAIGRLGGGRSGFAMFLEGGVYQRPILWGFELDGYAQAGVVGARRRDLFVDGGATFTRPLFKQFWAGFGIWGGAQPGLYRIDVGPRLTMRVRGNMRVHLDYRYRLHGNVEPGSGPAVTLAADF